MTAATAYLYTAYFSSLRWKMVVLLSYASPKNPEKDLFESGVKAFMAAADLLWSFKVKNQ